MTSAVDDVCQENSLRAIQNEYILEHMFSFLSVNDIKNCRLQNRVWRNVGSTILGRRTHVLFDLGESSGFRGYLFPHEYAISLENRNKMKEVSDYCKENTPDETSISPIKSFAFQGRIEYFHLTNFMDAVCSYMKELKIDSGIYHEENEDVTLNLSPKLPPRLTKLHIELNDSSNVTLCLCLDQIFFVKDIYFDNCTIVLDGNGKRLSPSYITLGPDNKYMKNGTEIKFLVNESFDLTLTKQINLNDENLTIDFSDCANDQVKRNVALKDITVRNWEMCNWKIKKFSLSGIPFLEKNSIDIEELRTDNLTIDLSKIYNPTSLVKLKCEENTTIAEAPFYLPNLVDVTLGSENCLSKLPYFTNNENISTMCLQSREAHAMSLNINDLPKGINKLALAGIGVHGEGVYPLQTLTMKHYEAMSKYSTFGSKFRPQTFRVWHFFIVTDAEIQSVVQLLNLSDSYGRLVIGKFNWMGNKQFHDSLISNYVDKEADCYVFQGRKGKGLTVKEVGRKYYNC